MYVLIINVRLKRTFAKNGVKSRLKKIHSKNVIETDPQFIKMPFAACIQGVKGIGKTVAAVQWVKHMEGRGSIILLVQSFHGLPRPIRLNCTVYIVISTSDEKQLDQIYQHFGNLVSRVFFFSSISM